MRRLALAGVLLAACTLASAQETPATKKPADKDKKADVPATPQVTVRQRKLEEECLNRRNEVILKLREIGQRTGDEALLRCADHLQELAWEVYLQKTTGASPPEPGRLSAAAYFQRESADNQHSPNDIWQRVNASKENRR